MARSGFVLVMSTMLQLGAGLLLKQNDADTATILPKTGNMCLQATGPHMKEVAALLTADTSGLRDDFMDSKVVAGTCKERGYPYTHGEGGCFDDVSVSFDMKHIINLATIDFADYFSKLVFAVHPELPADFFTSGKGCPKAQSTMLQLGAGSQSQHTDADTVSLVTKSGIMCLQATGPHMKEVEALLTNADEPKIRNQFVDSTVTSGTCSERGFDALTTKGECLDGAKIFFDKNNILRIAELGDFEEFYTKLTFAAHPELTPMFFSTGNGVFAMDHKCL